MELKGILTPEEESQGFTLEETEDFVTLKRWGKEVAVFSAAVTTEAIHQAISEELGKST